MIWATLAHVANDWLAVPLAAWLLVAVIHYDDRPSLERAALASVLLAMGLLTKAYFIAFVPVVAALFLFRRRWRDLGLALAMTMALAGPWYLRNVERYGTISGMQEVREGADPAEALRDIRLERLPAVIDSCARATLWTGNNSFESFSANTLRALSAACFAALLLWAASRHRSAEWIVLLYCGLFILALAYESAINYSVSHGETTGPGSWHTQAILVPMLALGLLGCSRWRKAGKFVAAAMMLLFGYVLAATYWVKLIPLYSGFEGHTTLVAVMALYGQRLSTVMTGLNDVCLAPAAMILFLSGLVSILAATQPVILTRLLLAWDATGAAMKRLPLREGG